MNQAALQKYLIRLFERHDVELEADEEFLMTDGDFPAVLASWHEGEAGKPGRLDIDIVLSEERQIEESFAGVGGGEAGCKDALANFERSALHVLLAACWYVTDDRKIDIRSWDAGIRTWDVFAGPLVVRPAGEAAIEAPAGLDGALETALKNEALSPELHWARLYFRRDADGAQHVEALLDNAAWAGGDRLLTSLAWLSADDAYVARQFVMLDVRDY